MAFQVVDDLLDYTEPEAVTGKPSGSDLREHKVTLPLIYALPRLDSPSRQEITALWNTPEPDDRQIAGVIGVVERAGGLTYARERASQLADLAEAELEALRPCSARDGLRAAIPYVLERRR
jgi:octaprenyl-diphosphate synthase